MNRRVFFGTAAAAAGAVAAAPLLAGCGESRAGGTGTTSASQIAKIMPSYVPSNLIKPGAFKFLVASQLIWKESGWSMIVYLAALAAISPSLYEAAAVDGAGWWQRLRHITLPGLKGISVLLLILNLGYALTFGFEQMLIQRGAVGPNASEVITTFAYQFGIVEGNFSYGAAAGLFLGVTSLILILAANKMAHLFGEDGLYRK